MKIGYKQLLDQAMSEIETLTAEEAVDLHEKDNVQFVDLRDIRELKHEGKIPGTYHMPRGMLEFWIDPESPYSKMYFPKIKSSSFIANRVGGRLWQPRLLKEWDYRVFVILAADLTHGKSLARKSKRMISRKEIQNIFHLR